MSDSANATADLIISARWVLPVCPEFRLLHDHSVVVRDGVIAAILPTVETLTMPAVQRVALADQLLMPGLINMHGHAAMTLFRGMADDYPLHTWLNDHIWPAEGRWVSENFVADGCALAMAEMLRAGTTCFSDMYFFPEAAAEEIHKAGMRAQLSFPIFDFPCAWGGGPEDYFRKGLALRDAFKHHDLIAIAFGPHAPYTVSDEPLRKVAMLAAETDAAIQIHLHETASEVKDSRSQYGMTPIARMAALDILGPRTQCVHLASVSDEDIGLLASHGCHAIHCPESNLKLASGFSPVEKMRRAGINIALGTDGAASNNDLDLFGEMRTAALLGKAVAGDATALPDRYAVEMATINGARALGLEQHIGSLEVGKQADIIAIDFAALEQQPLYNPVSQLVYTNTAPRVRHSWIKGRRMLDNGELTTLDTQALVRRAETWREKIQSA